MDSLWLCGVSRPEFEPLEGDARCDVLVIGGGLAGILCAHALTEAGVDCLLVEADRLCSGTTRGTTAKITLQHGLIYDALIRRLGEERARAYLEANRAAVGEYFRLAEKIDCDLRPRDAYVYSLDDRAALEREARAYERLGLRGELVEQTALPMPTAGALRVSGQADFNPLKLAYALSKGLRIYERTKVTELAPGRAVTERGVISADKIVVATHFPILNKHGAYFAKMYQSRSYVVALSGAADVGGMYIDGSGQGLTFRNAGELLLLGGGAHRTGKQGSAWRAPVEFAEKYYTGARIVYKYAAQDCMTLDGVPYIGAYSPRTEGLLVATGFNKWGITGSMVAAGIIRDAVLGKDNPHAEVFRPDRSILHPQLAVNLFESVKGLLTIGTPRCPHLGCALKYNRWEHSWDCSCHGSRFTAEGELIENPATDDLKAHREK